MGTTYSLIAALLIWPAFALAHPFHGSYAELGWSEDKKTIEVAMRVNAEDVEQALAAATGEASIPLEKIDPKRLTRWLGSAFRLYSGKSQQPQPLTLIGREVNYEASWIYFTVSADPEQKLGLEVPALLARHPQQQNRVRLLWQASKQIKLLFTSAQQRKQIWPLL